VAAQEAASARAAERSVRLYRTATWEWPQSPYILPKSKEVPMAEDLPMFLLQAAVLTLLAGVFFIRL
jgi:hypothetical protein